MMEVALTKATTTSSSPPPPMTVKDEPRKRRKICLCSCVGLSLLTVIMVIVLSLTVFKEKDPTTTINSFSVQNLSYNLDLPRMRVDFNLTLLIDLSIKNKNMVGFSYYNSTAAINYRGLQIGAVDLLADYIPSDGTKRMNLTLTLMVDRLLSETGQLFSDVVAGLVPMNTYIKIPGHVKILGLFSIHVKATSSCDFNVKISTLSVTDQSCTNKAKL